MTSSIEDKLMEICTISELTDNIIEEFKDLICNFDVNMKIRNKILLNNELLLITAVKYDNIKLVKILLEYGADPNGVEDNYSNTVLHHICEYNIYKELIPLLFEYDVEINKQNRDGNTPLHIATIYGQSMIVEELLKHGGDMTIKNNRGDTALSISKLWNKCHDIIKNYITNGHLIKNANKK